jgi:hypothetical protein
VGQHCSCTQRRTLDEELELRLVLFPRHRVHCRLGLGTRRVQHEHVDRAEKSAYIGNELVHLTLVGDICREGGGGAIPRDEA